MLYSHTCVCGDKRFESDDDEGDVNEVDEPEEPSVELPSSSELVWFLGLVPLGWSCFPNGIGRGTLS